MDTLIPVKLPKKYYRVGSNWPTLFKDALDFCKMYIRCQIIGRISKRNMMPLNPILEVKLFDVLGNDFMGLFPNSFGH